MSTPIQTLGPLRVRRLPGRGDVPEGRDSTEEKGPLTCVLLHGFGAGGDDLVGVGKEILAPPGTTFVFPEGLHALEDFILQPAFGARAWWRIDFAAIERARARGEERDLSKSVPEGLAEARAALGAMLDELAEQMPDDGRLVIGGFSQGAMLALDTALREPARELAGVVQLSGTLLAEEEWRASMPGRRGLPVFQSHGRTDDVLPFRAAERLRGALADAGLNVTFEPFREGHTITASVIKRLGHWLRAL